ncbi:MAG: YaaR family protein [bacterium]
MRVGDILEGRPEVTVPLEKNLPKTGFEVKKHSFLDKLKNLSSDQVREELDALLEKIDNQGRVLQNTMSLRDLLSYKSLIKDFMGVVVNRGYMLKEEFGWNQRGQSKSYQLLKKVDGQLEELTNIFFDKESEQVDLLSKMGEIRGLLVDLYM